MPNHLINSQTFSTGVEALIRVHNGLVDPIIGAQGIGAVEELLIILDRTHQIHKTKEVPAIEGQDPAVEGEVSRYKRTLTSQGNFWLDWTVNPPD